MEKVQAAFAQVALHGLPASDQRSMVALSKSMH